MTGLWILFCTKLRTHAQRLSQGLAWDTARDHLLVLHFLSCNIMTLWKIMTHYFSILQVRKMRFQVLRTCTVLHSSDQHSEPNYCSWSFLYAHLNWAEGFHGTQQRRVDGETPPPPAVREGFRGRKAQTELVTGRGKALTAGGKRTSEDWQQTQGWKGRRRAEGMGGDIWCGSDDRTLDTFPRIHAYLNRD